MAIGSRASTTIRPSCGVTHDPRFRAGGPRPRTFGFSVLRTCGVWQPEPVFDHTGPMLSDEQRDLLAKIERTKRPSPYAVGALDALARLADDDDRARIARVQRRAEKASQ